eukprot:1307311-Pleurochrysis_carterae.AAC.2
MYDGVQMYKELRDELLHLHDAHEADEQERTWQGKRRDRGGHATREDGACWNTGLGSLQGAEQEKKIAIAAAAMGRKGGGAPEGAPRGGAPYVLPNWQWCSKGTCHFISFSTRQGKSRWPIPPGSALARTATEKILKNKQQVERINNAR